MVNVIRETTINRTPEDVFDTVKNAETWPEWMPNILAARRTNEGAPESEAEFELQINRWGLRRKVHDEVTEYEPGSKVSFYCGEAQTGYGFATSPQNGKTRVTFSLNYEPGGVLSAADPALQRLMESYGDRVLSNLESYTEGEGPEPEFNKRLDEEWDIDRWLMAWGGGLALLGLTLGRLHDRRWRLLTAFVGANLLGHAVYGWCPPVPVLRAAGIRSRKEIEHHRHTGEF